MKVRSRYAFFIAGFLFLLGGYAFYLLFREHESSYLSYILFKQDLFDYSSAGTFSALLVDSLPSFLHVASFSCISIAFTRRLKQKTYWIPFFWLILNISFEFGQKNLFGGYFDWQDVIASLLGAFFVSVLIYAALSQESLSYEASCNKISNSIFKLMKGGAVVTGLLCIVATSDPNYTYYGYDPVYLTYDELRQPISATAPELLRETGKIYIYGNYLFINSPNNGIHVFDNTDPANPANLYFLKVPGTVDIAVKDNALYADSYIDLVTFDIQDIDNINEVALARIENVFPYDPYQNIPEDIYLNSYDETKGVVIGYREGGGADWMIK